MKPDRITAEIIDDARKNGAAILAEARQKAAEIVKEAEKEAAEYKETVLKSAAEEAKRAKERKIAAAELEGRKEVLACKQRLIDEAFFRARREMAGQNDEAYQKLLTKMIIQAAEGDEEIVLSAKDKARVSEDFVYYINREISKDNVRASMRLSEETAEIESGFWLKKGDVYLDYGFDNMARAMREDLEAEIASVLFGE